MTGLGNIDDVYKHYLKVVDENQQLKELLRECREMLEEYRLSEGDFTVGDIDTSLLLNMIDNVVGEKK